MPGGNPRYFDFGPTGCSRTHDAHRAAWQTPNDHVRQRHRVHLERDPALEQRASRGMALHCARQADAERLHRILQRTHARRAAQREPVSRSGPSPANHYRLGRRLEHEEATFIARLQNAGGLCRSSHRNWPSRSATRGLRALASCSHRANGRINCRGSNRRWMKVQWQVILTPENITRQWIMFEAGAMARSVTQARVCPILFGITKSEWNLRGGPLSFFQAAEF